jgi:membrane protein DedA with SNARE-associated domain
MPAIISLILTYKYLIIFPLAVIEGPFLSIALGYLVHAQYVNAYLTFLVLLAADILPDIFYYHLGKTGGRKVLEGKFFSKSKYTAENIKILEYLWHKHTRKTMFLGKLAYGIATMIIISAGIARLPLRTFVITSLPVGIFQIGILMLVGYHLGSSYVVAEKYIKYPGIAVAILVACVLVGYILLRKRIAAEFEKEEQKDASIME